MIDFIPSAGNLSMDPNRIQERHDWKTKIIEFLTGHISIEGKQESTLQFSNYQQPTLKKHSLMKHGLVRSIRTIPPKNIKKMHSRITNLP